jgi:hypothetical protein
VAISVESKGRGIIEPIVCPQVRDSEEVMLDEAILEQRLAALERAVANLDQRLAGTAASSNWLEKVTGSISDEAAFLEALEFGRAFRNADRPPGDPGEQP